MPYRALLRTASWAIWRPEGPFAPPGYRAARPCRGPVAVPARPGCVALAAELQRTGTGPNFQDIFSAERYGPVRETNEGRPPTDRPSEPPRRHGTFSRPECHDRSDPARAHAPITGSPPPGVPSASGARRSLRSRQPIRPRPGPPGAPRRTPPRRDRRHVGPGAGRSGLKRVARPPRRPLAVTDRRLARQIPAVPTLRVWRSRCRSRPVAPPTRSPAAASTRHRHRSRTWP